MFPIVARPPENLMRVMTCDYTIKLSSARPPTIFLCGPITGCDWRTEFVKSFNGDKVVFLNPCREYWNVPEGLHEKELYYKSQLDWQLEGLEKSDFIVVNFTPGSKSPVSLIEFGLFARSWKMIVHCPDSYWRSEVVRLICDRYAVDTVTTFSSLISTTKKFISKFNIR